MGKGKTNKKEVPIIYYDDPLNDEFSTAVITPKTIGDDYVYVHTSFFKKLTHFFWYRIVATPLAWFYLKIKFHHRIQNKKILKAYKKSGFFLFGNHTQAIGDALIPTMVSFPKDAYVVVHANNVSMPVLGRVTPSMGALPLPDTLKATRHFIQAMETRLSQHCPIVIYPEAHIWPYYTGIRPFSDKSFHYPVKYGLPSFSFTNTYQKRRFGKKPKIVTYVDGPFFPDTALPVNERRNKLRNQVYEAMCQRSKRSTVTVIEYRPREDKDPGAHREDVHD